MSTSATPSPSAPTDQTWTKVILPRRSLFQLPWRELWSYRDLILLMAQRDLTANYKQTALGPLWFILQPLLATVFFSFVFGQMAKISTDGIPHLLFYFSGLVLWNYLSECVMKTSLTFNRNSQLFGKVYFPRLVVPLATAITSLAGFIVQFSLFAIMLSVFYFTGQSVHPSWRMLFLPVFVLQLAMLGLGLGCIVAALSTKYRDLTLGIGFAVQLWMFASSVVFPLSRISEDKQWILLLNPVVPVIEGFRFAFLGFGIVGRDNYLISLGFCVAIFFIGITAFNYAEQTAMDSV